MQFAVGCRNDSDLDLDRARTTDPLKLAFLQHAQKFRLRPGRQLPDFIEQDRATVGELESAFALALRACKGAFFMAKQFALDESLRQRCAVHLYVWPVESRNFCRGSRAQ